MSFVCTICEKSFATKQNLTRHITGTKKCQKKKQDQQEEVIKQIKEEKDKEIEKILEEKFRELGERDERIYKLEIENEKLKVYKELMERSVDAPRNNITNNLVVSPEMVPLQEYQVPPNECIGRYINSRNFGKIISSFMTFNEPNKDHWPVRTRDRSRGVGTFLNQNREWVDAKHDEIGLTLQPKLYRMSSNYKEDIDENENDVYKKVEQYENAFWFNKMINNSDFVHRQVLKSTLGIKKQS